MKRILKHSGRLVLPFALLLALMPACADETLEEPHIYTPGQIRRLLHGTDTKLWEQRSEYYLEDSCRTGFLVRFTESGAGNVAQPQPFTALFYRDTLACQAGEEIFISHSVTTPRSPAFQTTDSLIFKRNEADSTIRLIRLLTSQQMELDVVKGSEVVRREFYRVVEEE